MQQRDREPVTHSTALHARLLLATAVRETDYMLILHFAHMRKRVLTLMSPIQTSYVHTF